MCDAVSRRSAAPRDYLSHPMTTFVLCNVSRDPAWGFRPEKQILNNLLMRHTVRAHITAHRGKRSESAKAGTKCFILFHLAHVEDSGGFFFLDLSFLFCSSFKQEVNASCSLSSSEALGCPSFHCGRTFLRYES